MRRWAAGLAVVGLLAAGACSSGGDDDVRVAPDLGDPGDCMVVDLAVSSEKVALMTELARTFNDSDDGEARRRLPVRPAPEQGLGRGHHPAGHGLGRGAPRARARSSGRRRRAPGARSSTSAWPTTASRRWPPRASRSCRRRSSSPCRSRWPTPSATPRRRSAGTDILRLATSEEGWAAYGHPEWGPFRLGKTNPNFSTSGLSALIAQAYAATGKTSGLSAEDLDNPSTEAFATGRRVGGRALRRHHADVPQQLVPHRPRGHVAAPTPRPSPSRRSRSSTTTRATPTASSTPASGPASRASRSSPSTRRRARSSRTTRSSSSTPPWVDDEGARRARRRFEEFVKRPENQRKVLEFGFRPGNPDVAVGRADRRRPTASTPTSPSTLLEVPSPPVLIDLLDKWAEQRKSARVLLVLDVSGSMSEVADQDTGETRLDLAKRAAIEALDQFKDEDEVGLRIFTTNEDGHRRRDPRRRADRADRAEQGGPAARRSATRSRSTARRSTR